MHSQRQKALQAKVDVKVSFCFCLICASEWCSVSRTYIRSLNSPKTCPTHSQIAKYARHLEVLSGCHWTFECRHYGQPIKLNILNNILLQYSSSFRFLLVDGRSLPRNRWVASLILAPFVVSLGKALHPPLLLVVGLVAPGHGSLSSVVVSQGGCGCSPVALHHQCVRIPEYNGKCAGLD